jgi:hypothetical protein
MDRAVVVMIRQMKRCPPRQPEKAPAPLDYRGVSPETGQAAPLPPRRRRPMPQWLATLIIGGIFLIIFVAVLGVIRLIRALRKGWSPFVT